MIPKIIHYCWFGNKELPSLYSNCIESWREKMPDYEIKLWTEKNVEFDTGFLNKNRKNENWAFVSDYVRMRVLRDYGGVYLDTDVEVVKSFDDLLGDECFLGYEDAGRLNTAVLAGVAGHAFFDDSMSLIDRRFEHGKPHIIAPEVANICAKRFKNDKFFKMYDYDVFYPYNPYSKHHDKHYLMHRFVTDNTYAIHHWGKAWNQSLLDRVRNKIFK